MTDDKPRRLGTVTIRKIGNSDGVILPKEMLERLGAATGAQFDVVELAGGGFVALPHDADFEKTMAIADETMDRYRDTLHALASA